MFRQFFLSTRRADRLYAWAGLCIYVCHALYITWLSLQLNSFYADFYEILGSAATLIAQQQTNTTLHLTNDDRTLSTQKENCLQQLFKFVVLVAPSCVIHPLFKWMRQRWCLQWRSALVQSYLHVYEPYMSSVEGASQRVQEDTARFSAGIDSAIFLILEVVLTLCTFSPLLIRLGGKIPAWQIRVSHAHPTWLLMVAWVESYISIICTYFLSKPLVSLEIENQKVEAAFRKLLSAIEIEHSLHQVTEQNGRTNALLRAFSIVVKNYKLLFLKLAHVNFFLSCFEQAVVLTPYFLVAPLLFQPGSGVTLGLMMKTTDAFGRVSSSLIRMAEAIPELNDWRSVRVRLKAIEDECLPNGKTQLVTMSETVSEGNT